MRRRVGLITLAFVGACADSFALATYDGPDASAPDAAAPGGDASPLADTGSDTPDAAGNDAGALDGGAPDADSSPSAPAPLPCVGFHETWPNASAWMQEGRVPLTPPAFGEAGSDEVSLTVLPASSNFLARPLPSCSIEIALSIEFDTSPDPTGVEVVALRGGNEFEDIGFFLSLEKGLIFPLATSASSLPYTTGQKLTLSISNGSIEVVTPGGATSITETPLHEIDIGGVTTPSPGPNSPDTFTFGKIDVTLIPE